MYDDQQVYCVDPFLDMSATTQREGSLIHHASHSVYEKSTGLVSCLPEGFHNKRPTHTKERKSDAIVLPYSVMITFLLVLRFRSVKVVRRVLVIGVGLRVIRGSLP